MKPLQRLCKYPLLIKEMLKNTPADHPDYANLSLSLTKFKDIVDAANEKTRHTEQVRRLQNIRDIFEKSDCADVFEVGRKYIYDTRPMLIKEREKPFEVLMVLFNDLIFIAKQRKDGLSGIKKIPVREVAVRDIPDSSGSYIIVVINLYLLPLLSLPLLSYYYY